MGILRFAMLRPVDRIHEDGGLDRSSTVDEKVKMQENKPTRTIGICGGVSSQDKRLATCPAGYRGEYKYVPAKDKQQPAVLIIKEAFSGCDGA